MPKSNADIVNDWYRDRLTGGELARHTPAYNQVVAALPALIADLDATAAANVVRKSGRTGKEAAAAETPVDPDPPIPPVSAA